MVEIEEVIYLKRYLVLPKTVSPNGSWKISAAFIKSWPVGLASDWKSERLIEKKGMAVTNNRLQLKFPPLSMQVWKVTWASPL
jgi:hypothetical protein